ncbi:related to nuclear protein SA-1 [Rhynchosporium graminicola]|uniref:Related to nuclear protein SA-1 n=1 Tax=Rhynchosporium graminicola TaxID=2792576 RepID=A0A1E1LBK2_9HELO|nr:related to nuclear protein SA-1 [Rhynchosporium commune]
MTTTRTPLLDISTNDVMSSPAAIGSRRKSGRAVKVPQKFQPEVDSSHAGSATSKRKRTDGEEEGDASNIEEAEDSDDANESAGEEEEREVRKKAKKTKKPAAKKVKVHGTAAYNDEPLAVKLPARPKKSGKRVAIADKEADGLYADVFQSGDTSETVVTRWLNKYNEDNISALADLINLVLRSAGCSIEITSDDVNDEDNVMNKLADLQDEHQAKNITDYPLTSKTKSSHAFRDALVGFFDQLIQAIHDTGILYNEKPLIENIDVWISTLSSSTLRPFRHTATLVALTIMTAMCRVAHHEIEAAAKTSRQIESEKNKKGANKARLADFQKKVKTNEDNETFLKERIQGFFDTVYTHRYRDVDPKIRTECAEAMGSWMMELESMFFEGQYLRYMGWMLSDTHGSMRLEVVKQLSKLMNSLNPGGMRHFVERFRPRMVEMATRDSEPGIRAAAVDLMGLIREQGMLEPDDIDTLGKLIFDTDPKVRKAIVTFFLANVKDAYEARVEELGGEESIEDLLTVDDEDDYDSPRGAWIQFKCLAECLLGYDAQDSDDQPSQIALPEFLDTSVSESRFTLAAQALYDKSSMLKDWEVLAGYLLYDHTAAASENEVSDTIRDSFKPTEQEELVLLEILNAVVKVSLASVDESARDKGKSKASKAEIAEANDNAARRLAGLIPRLLKKYGADPKTATLVLRLEHVLNLGVFQELRQDTTVYSQLLDDISAQFNSHADRTVLAEAVAAFLHARGHEELEELADNKILSLWEDTANSLRQLNQTGNIAVRGSFKVKVLKDLSHTLIRLEQLSTIASSVDTLEEDSIGGEPLPIVILLDIIARGVFEDANDEEIDGLEDDIVLSAMKSAMFYFMWKIRALTDAVAIEDDVPDIDIDHLRQWQEIFMQNVTAAFSSRATLDPVRLIGAGTVLDVHVLFTTLRPSETEADAEESPYYLNLIKPIIPEVHHELISIFDALEKQFAKKSHKKLAEPSDDEEPEELDEEPEDDEEELATDNERQAEALTAERELCEFTGKVVLAILAGVIDASGPLKGKLRSRLQRNRSRLGPNFKDIIAYLDEPKTKGKKGKNGKSTSHPKVGDKQTTAKSDILAVDEEDEEDDPFADVEPEEGTVEDLRRRELLDDEPEASLDGDGVPNGGADEVEDDIMGD